MNIRNWWYNIQILFSFHIEISLLNFIVSINIFLIDFNIKTNFPCLLNYLNSIYNKSIKLTQNKTLEIQLTFSNNLITGINIYKNIHSDHTPFSFEMSILGLTLIIIIYDHRHWDYENNKYEEYKNN
jgi:hypothetical protein